MLRFLVVLIVVTGGLIWSVAGFRQLWEMETGAAQADVLHHDGVYQRSTIGPKSYWPEWIPRPGNAAMTVRAHYFAAPNHPATGFANLAFQGQAAVMQANYARTLTAAGWHVALSHQDLAMPEVPPRTQRLCYVIANKAGRSILLAVGDGAQDLNRLFWRETPQVPVQGAVSGGC